MLRTPFFLACLLITWLFAIGLGQSWLLIDQDRVCVPATAPDDWPGETTLQRVSGRFTLVLFAHPHCPCTRAGIEALHWILDRSAMNVNVFVIFVCPEGAPTGWDQTSLRRRVTAISALRAVTDASGTEARRFGVETSGQGLLYDPEGHLVFSGGLTQSRGHEGDSDGRRAVLDWLTAGSSGCRYAPVFGCPLMGEDSRNQQGASECKQQTPPPTPS
jgi:hypothetical protein